MKTPRNFWQVLFRRSASEPQPAGPTPAVRTQTAIEPMFDIAPSDPLLLYFQHAPGAVDIQKLQLDSPALRKLRTSGVQLVVPLLSQGDLIGLLNLGPRLSEQDYSSDDRALLNTLATQASPAVRVAQLVQQQQAEVQQRERLEQELRVARLIQQTLLPKHVPALDGWRVNAFYQPARAVGGDFYDFIDLPDGRIAFVIGDVTDKGVPAALVMATVRAILRTSAQRLIVPSAVLEQVNDLLHPDIPPKMFVTCLYAVLDPPSGRLQYANAGHDVPYRRTDDGVLELRARGMPLGLMPGMSYEEKEITVGNGESILFYSDGLVEAHDRAREMFGFPRLQSLMKKWDEQANLIEYLRAQLESFTGAGWEQEDDVTLMTLERACLEPKEEPAQAVHETWRTLKEFSVASVPGNERAAMQGVAEALEPFKLPRARVERVKTAVSEATMNAIEHGNHNRAEVPVDVAVLASEHTLLVRITDQGGHTPITAKEEPDLEAKLAGLQSPRGWGLYLIKNLVDELRVGGDEQRHVVELMVNLDSEQPA
ncbi:MAG: GAF domain-containing protein [Chloroflexi bacterium]|nr:MAG: GAF domain-containing protein [Chloroflexota bacterium]